MSIKMLRVNKPRGEVEIFSFTAAILNIPSVSVSRGGHGDVCVCVCVWRRRSVIQEQTVTLRGSDEIQELRFVF